MHINIQLIHLSTTKAAALLHSAPFSVSPLDLFNTSSCITSYLPRFLLLSLTCQWVGEFQSTGRDPWINWDDPLPLQDDVSPSIQRPPALPLLSTMASRIYRESIENLSRIYRESIENPLRILEGIFPEEPWAISRIHLHSGRRRGGGKKKITRILEESLTRLDWSDRSGPKPIRARRGFIWP